MCRFSTPVEESYTFSTHAKEFASNVGLLLDPCGVSHLSSTPVEETTTSSPQAAMPVGRNDGYPDEPCGEPRDLAPRENCRRRLADRPKRGSALL